jgi:hypothetical protein
MEFLSTWLVVSLTLWAYFVSKAWLMYVTLFELSLSLASDRLLAVLSFNLLCSLLCTIAHLSCVFFTGPISDSDFARHLAHSVSSSPAFSLQSFVSGTNSPFPTFYSSQS